jgi:hypothetical protein
VDRVLQSANCRGGYSDRASCVVSGVKSVGTVQSLFGGIGLSLYRLVTCDKLCDKWVVPQFEICREYAEGVG